MPKTERRKAKDRHMPLDMQIREDDPSVVDARKEKKRKGKAARTEREVESFVSDKLSKKILEQAREQQQEMDDGGVEFPDDPLPPLKAKNFRAVTFDVGEDSDSADEGFFEDEEHYLDDVEEVTEQDERMMAMFLGGGDDYDRPKTIADLIGEQFDILRGQRAPESSLQSSMDPKIVEVYTSVGKILSTYRSGPVPKAFKIVPALENWEDILVLTNPPSWTPHAMYQATRLFASNLKAEMAQRFYNLVLLPCVREHIEEYGRLNYHLYMALKKSMYKPGAFFKGVVIPLCESMTCTLREAAIVASVIKKVSIPPLHAAAALLRIAEMPYTGANTIFLLTLIDKKYALPLRVVDAVVNHFVRFVGHRDLMPVIWHKALLVFAQRYKNDIEPEQKDRLKDLLRAQNHPSITKAIHFELFAKVKGQSRVVLPGDATMTSAQPAAPAAATTPGFTVVFGLPRDSTAGTSGGWLNTDTGMSDAN